METNHNIYMLNAIKLSLESIKTGGGPFGAVIVKEGKIIATGANSVTNDHDPTAHAEVNAIRNACSILNTINLSGCTIYTSCEPCPMCLGAIYWAHIDKVYYANTKNDARNIGFDDSLIYNEIALPVDKRKIDFVRLMPEEALKVFVDWEAMENKTKY